MRGLDLAVVAVYVAAMAWLGLRFSRRQTSTENYFVAKRSVPSWAMGMSMLATMVSSVTFVAYPGSSYAKDWSLLVPGFMLIAVLPLVGRVIIPFYRERIGMSAYEYFEKRFGRPARFYAAFAFSLAHFSKMGFVLYLMALTLSSITGWEINTVIVLVAAVMILYAVKGGIEAIVWTDVVQGFVMGGSILVVLGYLLWLPEGGPGAVLGKAWAANKFQLGLPAWDFHKNTVPVLLLYGLFWYLQRYVADQTMVQRYLMAKSDEAAFRGVRVGAFLSVPMWAMFMFVGTCVWGLLPGDRRDNSGEHHEGRPDVSLLPEPASAAGRARLVAGLPDGFGDDDARQRLELDGGGGGGRLLPRVPAAFDGSGAVGGGQGVCGGDGPGQHRHSIAAGAEQGQRALELVCGLGHRERWPDGTFLSGVDERARDAGGRLLRHRGEPELQRLGGVDQGREAAGGPGAVELSL